MKKNIIMLAIVSIFTINCGGDNPITNLIDDIHTVSFDSKIKSWQSREITEHDESFQDRIETWTMNEEDAMDTIFDIFNHKPVPKWRKETNGDYWKTSKEFEQDRYEGDCDDIAIWRYITLRLSGRFSDDDLIIRIVPNYYDDGATHHIIVVVYTHGESIILDNNILTTESEEHANVHTEFTLFDIK